MRKMFSKRHLIILCSFLMLSFNVVSAQGVSLNFSQKNLKTVLDEISKQTGYSLAYSKEVVNLNDVVTINVSAAELSDVLNELLLSRNFNYEIKDNKIYILYAAPAKSVKSNVATQQQQEDVQIAGVVTDNFGEPIIGANVTVSGTTIGTITDIDGKYTLSVPRGSVLRFSYIGYNSQDVRITNQTTVNVSMMEDIELLDELVVIGYGAVKRGDITTAVSSVSTKDLMERPIVSAAQAIQGKAAGVQVVQPSGQPGQGMVVRIRGNTSITASNDPLYVVDGVPTNDINFLAPGDIESMQILKDASSAAIYGSRASNGVVLITTHEGKAGVSKISFSSYVGTSKVIKQMESLNVSQYKELMDDLGAVVLPGGLKDETDWFSETFRTGLNQNYQLSITSGNDKLRYHLSGGYTDEKGILNVSYYKRYNIRANIDN